MSETADLTSPVARPRTLSIMPTLQCNAACTDCGTDSNPRARGRLSLENICRAIDEASEDGFVVVVFTGGEATLARRELLAGIEYAAGRGLPTRLVTNGHWSRSEDSARRRIAEWCQAGLNEINFSTGDEHVRFVPIYRVATAARLSVEAGLRVSIMVEYRSDSTVTRRDLEALLDVDNLRRNYPDSYLSIIESPWMPLSPHEVANYPPGTTIDASNIAGRKGCDSVLQTITVQGDGALAACCGLGMRRIPELEVGHVQDTSIAEAQRRAESDFLKLWLRVEGPERILAWAAQKNPDIAWEGQYAHRCQACLRMYGDPAVRRVISEHWTEKVADISFASWLLFEDISSNTDVREE